MAIEDIRHLNTQCKVVIFPWDVPIVEFQNNDLDDNVLSSADARDISKYLMSCSYTKTLAQPAGAFSITLPNSHDWRRLIEPGTWLLIYMSNEGDLQINNTDASFSGIDSGLPEASPERSNVNLRCIGNVDRVAINYVVGDNGERDIVYEVMGRDIGVVYEETTIWLNMFRGEGNLLQGFNDRLKISSTEGLDVLLSTIHDLFFFPQRLPGFNSTKELTSIGEQWLMPRNLINQYLDVGLASGNLPFFGNIDGVKNFNASDISFPVTNVMNLIKGNAWSVLKSLSFQQLHEFYIELNDFGIPQTTFRMIPWSINPGNYPKLQNNAIRYHDLQRTDSVLINGGDIYSVNLGRDNHSRFNHYLTTQMSQQVRLENNLSLLENTNGVNRFPFSIPSSIKRHGFRDQHTEINQTFLIRGSTNFGPTLDIFLLQNANEFMLDIWESSHLFETGSMTIIGNNDIRVGKVLKVDTNSEFFGGRVYYIEGYTDSFTVDENGTTSWEQQLTLTKGIQEEALKSISNIGTNKVENRNLVNNRNGIIEDAEDSNSMETSDSFIDDNQGDS